MIYIIIAAFVATICLQFPNMMGINNAETLTLATTAKIAAISLPFTTLSTMGFIYFYGKGYEFLSYPTLYIAVNSLALFISIILQVFILKNKEINAVEIVGALIVLLGIITMIYNKEIAKII